MVEFDQILQIERLGYAENDVTYFKDLDLYVNKGDKIAVLSKDSLAITSLFKILAGEIQPTSGSFTFGQTITPAYLPSNNEKYFQSDDNLIDWLREFAEDENKDEIYIRGFLGKMLFSGEEVFKKADVKENVLVVKCIGYDISLSHFLLDK